MTMIEVVSKLQSQGHQVGIYVRKDGGILIKSIDGQKFTGATGNKFAREIAGTSISEARVQQLKYATRARKVKRPTLDDEVYSQWQRVKKIWSKAFKAKGGKPHPAGYFGWARIKYSISKYGRAEALRRISEAEKYATGFAYSKNVEYLHTLIKDAGNKYNSDALLKLAEDLKLNAYAIQEDWIYPAYKELYKLNDGVPPQEVARATRAVLRL